MNFGGFVTALSRNIKGIRVKLLQLQFSQYNQTASCALVALMPQLIRPLAESITILTPVYIHVDLSQYVL